MAEGLNHKKNIVTVLTCVEKVTSFASSFNPIFGIVSSLIGVARKGLAKDEENPLDKDFQELNSTLESISQKNKECLSQIRIDEVNETYGKHEQYIRHQYDAFNTMVARVKKDPDGTQKYMEEFRSIYERDKMDTSLKAFYDGVTSKETVFGRSLLKVYMENCNSDLKIMEHRCSHFAHLFHMGLIALMAYTAVTEDDEEEVRKKWSKRMLDVQQEMEKCLSQCKDKNS